MDSGENQPATNIPSGATSQSLTQAEAERLLEQVGYNELVEEKTSPILKFLSYLWGPIPWMIEIAALLSGFARQWEYLGIILVLLIERRVGESLDFWRVETIETGQLLCLRAEMRIPGRAWIQFQSTPLEGGKTLLTPTAYFAPKGVAGLIYWYSLYPIHTFLFSGLIRKIAEWVVTLAHSCALHPVVQPIGKAR